jgi:hypothetical protein
MATVITVVVESSTYIHSQVIWKQGLAQEQSTVIYMNNRNWFSADSSGVQLLGIYCIVCVERGEGGGGGAEHGAPGWVRVRHGSHNLSTPGAFTRLEESLCHIHKLPVLRLTHAVALLLQFR